MSEMKNAVVTAPVKKTKAERLAEELEVARKRLAEAQARLQPQIDAADAEIEQLKKMRDATKAAYDESYQKLAYAREVCVRRLGLGLDAQPKLLTAVAVFLEQRNLSRVDVGDFADRYIAGRVASDPDFIAETRRHDESRAAERRAYAAWNVATSSGGKRAKLSYKLLALSVSVEKLEKEIVRLPAKRETERDRRREEREAELCDRDMQAALAVLGEFQFNGEGPVQ